MRVLFGFKDTGGASAVLPVAAEARKERIVPVLYSDGVSYERFKENLPLISAVCDLGKVIDWFRPHVAVVTLCSPGGVVPVSFIKICRERHIKVVALQDYWGNHKKQEWEVFPDAICVQDEYARDSILKTWQPSYACRVFITGQPAFDRLKDVDCTSVRAELCKMFGLIHQDWPIVHFSGQLLGQVPSIKAVIKAPQSVNRPVYFFMRDHPRILALDAPPAYKETYKEYKDFLSGIRWPIQMCDSSCLTSLELLTYGADLNVSISSTTLLESCYLQKPCVSIWIPEAKEAVIADSKGGLAEFPPARLGACLQGITTEELALCFEQIFKGCTQKMSSAQRKYYPNDGRGAKRVYEVVRSMVG